VTLTPLGVLAV